MPRMTYHGERDRYYPALGLMPEPGESYSLPIDPADGRWRFAKADDDKRARADKE